ncbi:putative nuclease HARBI1 [Lineus longissimus]|uniref:putative nuclease HARBI1 n=1 Tax=Lineus longissimus TaxID=88925 RepID=UPI00315D1FF6
MAVALLLEDENRRALRRNRIIRDRIHPLELYDDVDMIKRYRMPRHVLLEVVDMIGNDLDHPTRRNHAIPPTLQVLCALRYFANGNFQYVSGDLCGISQSSVSRIILRVATALTAVAPNVITFPRHPYRLQAIKEGFYSPRRRIPNVIGCVDGSLVPIVTPSLHEDAYVSRKHSHAINVQGICDSDMKFTNLVARWPGLLMMHLSGIIVTLAHVLSMENFPLASCSETVHIRCALGFLPLSSTLETKRKGVITGITEGLDRRLKGHLVDGK